jgi:HAD superfamily hydrolase (TIGR01509 family)
VPGLIFDCDGVLGDTERHGHLPAFNRTFEEFGLPARWSDEEYARKVRIGGGKERMKTLLTPEFIAEAGLPSDTDALDRHIARWHRRKTEIYREIIAGGAVPPRPGVHRIAAEADAAGWTLAVASTSAEPSVRAMLEHAAGPELAARFRVFAGDVVPRKKPAPDIYEFAVAQLGLRPGGVVAIEDSRAGMLSAIGAGLGCVVTTSAYTRHEDFDGALLVVDTLGDPASRGTASQKADPAGPGAWEAVTKVLSDPLGSNPRPFVRLSDLEFLLAGTTAPEAGRPHGSQESHVIHHHQ